MAPVDTMASEVRQRRATKKKRTKASAASEESKHETASDEKTPSPSQEEEETAWQTIKSHPLAMVLPIVLIPYSIYVAFLFVYLQRPDLVTAATGGIVQLRPPVSITDERQLLIVGTMSCGTVQVASDLQEQLHLEVGHEISDASWNFVRDGTVSWWHGTRFFEPIDLKELVVRWSTLCVNYTENMGFHPSMYKSYECSRRQKWSKCWGKLCFEILRSEFGCAWSHDCETPFHSTLLQVRHPMRTLESLVTKFCQGGLNGTIHPAFVTYATALFPNHEFQRDSCIEATGYYLVEYNQILMNAYSKGLIDDMYRIEETSPCDVARMAGLMDPATTVYAPNFAKVTRICDDKLNDANEVMKSTKHKVNEGQVYLTWEDLRGGMHASQQPKGDTKLEKAVRGLTKKLGYDPNQEYAADVEFAFD